MVTSQRDGDVLQQRQARPRCGRSRAGWRGRSDGAGRTCAERRTGVSGSAGEQQGRGRCLRLETAPHTAVQVSVRTEEAAWLPLRVLALRKGAITDVCLEDGSMATGRSTCGGWKVAGGGAEKGPILEVF